MSRPASAARLGSFNFPSVEYWWGVGVVGENYQEGLQKRRVKNVQYKEGLQLVLNNFFFGAIISLVSIVWKDDGETHPMRCRSDRTVFKRINKYIRKTSYHF